MCHQKSFDKVIDTCPNPPANPEHLKNWQNHNHNKQITIQLSINLYDENGYTKQGIVSTKYGFRILCNNESIVNSGVIYNAGKQLNFIQKISVMADSDFLDSDKYFNLNLDLNLLLNSVSAYVTDPSIIVLSAIFNGVYYSSKQFSIPVVQNLSAGFTIGTQNAQIYSTVDNKLSFNGYISNA